MKSRHEFPISGVDHVVNPGEYIVVWDDDYTHSGHHMRIHLKTEGSYIVCHADDFNRIGAHHEEGRIFKTHPNFAKLEPFMNLMGTREDDGYLPAFVVTKEELENILGG